MSTWRKAGVGRRSVSVIRQKAALMYSAKTVWSSIMLSGHAHHAPPNVAYRSSSRHQ